MGTGVCLFLAGKLGFNALGLRLISNETIESWSGIKILEFVLLDTGIQ
jgi:hypothetical protein